MSKNFKTLTEAEYRAYPCESYSSIKYLLEDVQTYHYYKSKPFQGNDSSLLGTTIHHYLQGNKHLVTFSIVDKRKKTEYEEFVKNFRELSGDEGIIVPKSFEEKVNSINQNLNENKQVLSLLKDCKFEEPFLFTHNGVDLKGKVDGVKEDRVIEIKTSSMATTAQEFKREAYNRDYDLQAFLYLAASGKTNHYFIVVNTTPPYKVTTYRSSKEFLESGKNKANIVTERYKKHIINGEPFLEDNLEKNIEEI